MLPSLFVQDVKTIIIGAIYIIQSTEQSKQQLTLLDNLNKV